MTDTYEHLDYSTADFLLAEWQVSPLSGKLYRGNDAVSLTSTQIKLLTLLTKNYPEAVSREKVMETLWPDSVVTDESVSRAIADLRKSLGDSSRNPNYIKTISKKGYLLVEAPQPLNTSKPVSTKMRTFAALAAVLVILFLFVYFYPTQTQHRSFADQKFVKAGLGTSGELNRRPQFDNQGRFATIEKRKGLSVKLWLYDMRNDTETLLFPESNDSFSTAAFSHDGQELAYFRHLAEETEKGYECHVEVYNFKTQKNRKLRSCDMDGSSSLDWFPDDKHLLTTGFKPALRRAGLAMIDAQTGKIEDLAFPDTNRQGYLFSRLSPSSEKIAFIHFIRDSDTSKIGIFNRQDGSIRHLNINAQSVQQVDWGKDDSQLFYSDTGSTNTGLWMVDLITHKQTLLHGDNIRDFDFSANSNVFVAIAEDFSVALQENFQAELTSILEINAKAFLLDTTAKAKHLAYVSEQGGQANIWLLDRESKQTRRITDSIDNQFFDLRLSHSGRHLAYLQSAANETSLVILDLQQNLKKVYQAENVNAISWNLNQDALLYYHGEGENRLMQVELDPHQEIEASELGGLDNLYKMALSASDELIVQYAPGQALYKLDSLASLKQNIAPAIITLPDRNFGLWDVTGNTIHRIEYSQDTFAMHVYKLDGTELADLRRPVLTDKHIVDFAFDRQADMLYLLEMASAKLKAIKLLPLAQSKL